MRILIFTIFFVFAGIGAILWTDNRPRATLQAESGRIVSLAPSITESLYALGLGDRIAGVTSFCTWPLQARDKPIVGGFRDINLEAIARADADLAVLPDDMNHYGKPLENLGLTVMTFESRSLPGFLRDLHRLGATCGVPEKAAELISGFRNELNNPINESSKKPTVLFALMNPDECARPITELTILGADGFYNELIHAAGGRNVYESEIPYPRLAREAIMALNPDVIVAAIPDCPDRDRAEKNWRNFAQVGAITNDRLLLLGDSGDTIPGPRSLATLRKLTEVIHRQNTTARQ